MFWIDKLTVTGYGKRPSIIDFKNGLNIIYGPSNTGKTYIISCIDYVFGSDSSPFSEKNGYDSISLIINSDKGHVTLTRKINSRSIDVTSQHGNIDNGTYSSKSKKNPINRLFLELIGISEVPKIISSQDFKTQNLSWRNILHMCLIPEERIIRKASVLLPEQPSAIPPSISALTYLATGENFEELLPKEPLKLTKVKNEAVESYIQSELNVINTRKKGLLESESQTIDFEEEVDKATNTLLNIQQKIAEALKNNQVLLGSISERNEKLAECTIMKNRYMDLKTQYISDLERLNFIADAAVNSSTSHTRSCPFCSSSVKIKDSKEYAFSAQAEHKKISLQLKDLERTIVSVASECEKIKEALDKEMYQYEDTQQLIETDLKPQADELKAKLYEYKKLLKTNTELIVLGEQVSRMTTQVAEIANGESQLMFKVKDHLPADFIHWMSEFWSQALVDCKFDVFSSAFFDKRTMDVSIDGQKKADHGKGYRAYLNTLNALGTILYLKTFGKYCPQLLILDSPILSLKEKIGDEQSISSSMRSGLFCKLLENESNTQIIIVENDIPDIDYGDANIIEFTKSTEKGRYGFLMDVNN